MLKKGLKSKITRFYQPVYFGILTNFLFSPSILTLKSKGSQLLSGKNPLKPLITVATRPESHSHLSPAKDSHLISSRTSGRDQLINRINYQKSKHNCWRLTLSKANNNTKDFGRRRWKMETLCSAGGKHCYTLVKR